MVYKLSIVSVVIRSIYSPSVYVTIDTMSKLVLSVSLSQNFPR